MEKVELTEKRNREIVKQLFDELMAGIFPAKMDAMIAARGCIESFSQFFTCVSEAFPVCELTIEDMVLKGDRVLVRYTLQGTPIKPFKGISAPNQTVTVSCLDIFRLKDARIVEHRDTVYQINVLGAGRPAGPPRA